MKKLIVIAASIALLACGPSSVKNSTATGNKRMSNDTPELELENKLSKEQKASIPWGIGTGISTDRQMARTESIAQAQAATARNAKLIVEAFVKSYAKNVNQEAQRMSQDKINNYVLTQVEGSYVFETIMEFNEQSQKFSVYTLVLLDPNRVIEALKAQEELGLLADDAKMQEEMDKMRAEYKNLLQK